MNVNAERAKARSFHVLILLVTEACREKVLNRTQHAKNKFSLVFIVLTSKKHCDSYRRYNFAYSPSLISEGCSKRQKLSHLCYCKSSDFQWNLLNRIQNIWSNKNKKIITFKNLFNENYLQNNFFSKNTLKTLKTGGNVRI